MKNASKVLTPEQAAVEDFINAIPPAVVETEAGLVDNTITEVLPTEDVGLDPIIDSVAAADNLDQLATDVDGITQAPALESYKRIFQHMTQMSGHPATFSMEEFGATKGGVRKFAKAIRGHADLIRSCVSIGLEDYIDKVDESIGTTMSNYKQALQALSQVNENEIAVDGNVTINHKQVWSLFHMDGKLMDLRSFGAEVDAVKKLAEVVSKNRDIVAKWASQDDLKTTVLSEKLTVNLMNNMRVTIKDGRSHWEQLPVPKPDKSWTAGDWFWIFMFSWAGLVYRLIKGGSGEEKTKKEQSLKAVHKVVGEMKRLAPIVQQIEKDAQAIMSMVEKVEKDQQADNVKQIVSPVLELAAKTIEHVASVTYGAKKMFEAAEK